ncbi:radical SAM protein with 4Fe4S-binding SPASM domain [Natranaerovirga pectinivora]|uniref:Radical SAM protein with 4Fe4S-binding SPASM domain n=1 Tax=Natranaerovirga pectinivora TaxID=682400 RepID=A0A4R3MNF9_9FIRM|nr:radical SAM/SPASM domain-containing protein [Natranaerovirga pectinivora]TCT16795.1 radical SAM protein with 4Fe4S-binding SPASM domain [Natranaerovirga pectinivora]
MIINPYDNILGKSKSILESRYPTALERYIMPTSVYCFDRLFIRKNRKKAIEYLKQKEFPLFKTIEIETINRCNGTCSFCPVNKNADPRPLKLMDELLFISIMKELRGLNYSGSIGLYSNNEPLLDKRLTHFLQIAKSFVPNAKLYLFTNGSLLTIEKYKELMKYLDWITIDNYNDRLTLNEATKKVYQYAISTPHKAKTHIYLRKENEILTNRSGQANNRSKNNIGLKSVCMYPFEQAVIRPDGKMSLCCNDATGKVTMGDLTQQSLYEIWHSKIYNTIRYNLLEDRKKNHLCNQCDIVTAKLDVGSNFKVKNIIKMFKV